MKNDSTPVEAERRSSVRLDASYLKASWRCVLAVDAESKRIGIGFNLEDGSIVRLGIDLMSAWHLSTSIDEFLSDYLRRKRLQLSSSVGILSVEASKDPLPSSKD